MAWVRIHDGALSHPKLAGLVDLRDPFTLWIWGLSYCQAHLTDGLIVRDAVPKEGRKSTRKLVELGLWKPLKRDWIVHDFLHWNDSREVVEQRKTKAKLRMSFLRSRERTPHVRGIPNGERSGNQTKPYIPPYSPPFPGGRITRAERQQAEAIRRQRIRCPHEPHCPNAEACLHAVVAELRNGGRTA
jgi:hypothetical protein